jgi:hypothetical protein
MNETNPPSAAALKNDITVPQAMMAGREHETLRSPPQLNRHEIVRRLVEIREFDPAGAGGYFGGVERMSAARIGARVIAALNSLQEKSGHPFVAEQLQIVALNLKNLD